MTGESILACYVGGTKLRAAVVDPDGSIRSKRVIPTPPKEPGALVHMMRKFLEKYDANVSGAVVGVPGPVDYSAAEVLKLPNLPDWEGHISADGLSTTLSLPVLLANDADLAALGEYRYGAGRGYRDMLYITSSTGVGAGVILNGRLLHGRLSLAEVGHTIIDRATQGTVESLGSGTALERLAGEHAVTAEARAKCGDLDALRQFATVAENFAIGVFNLAHCFSPEIVVVGGGMSHAGALLFDPIRSMLTRCGAGCPAADAKVVLATGGDDVGLRGAAAYWNEYRER